MKIEIFPITLFVVYVAALIGVYLVGINRWVLHQKDTNNYFLAGSTRL
jgi:hypothetical protein